MTLPRPWANDGSSGLSNWQKFGMGTAAGGMLGGGVAGMFANPTNPADAAKPYLDRIQGDTKPYYDPYIQAGNEALPEWQRQLGQLLNDPGALMNRFGQSYQQSPGYKWQLGQGEQAISNAMASGGMAGSPEHGQRAGQLAENMANQDYYNYMNKVLGLYGSGLSGEQNMVGTGFNASRDYANLIANALAGQAGYAYAGQAGANQGDSQNMSNLFGGLGAVASIASLL